MSETQVKNINDIKVGGEAKPFWLFPDDINKEGEELVVEELQMRTTKNTKEPWPVYVITRKKDGKTYTLSGFALTSKEKFRVQDIVGKVLCVVPNRSRVNVVGINDL